jgi:predicted AlkP superfamily pyrophosphatase or phosphodiesterase
MSRKTRWIVLIVAATAVVAVVGAVLLLPIAVDDAAELLQQGGVVELRDELRPARGTTRVLIIAIDGVGDGDLRHAIRAGHMPHTSRLLGKQLDADTYEHAYAVPDVLTILPSMTMAAWSSVFTGKPPSETGIPGNEWYVREEMRFYAPGPVTVEDYTHTIEMFTNGLLSEAVRAPTLFERVNMRSHVALMPVFRGADLLVTPGLSDVGQLFGKLAEGLADDDVRVDRKPYAQLDEASVERLIETFEEYGVPDIAVAYLAGVDLYTHLAEPAIPRLHDYLHEVADPVVARLVNTYAELGVLDDTYIIFVSDHGHTPVLKDERHALGTNREKDPPIILEQAGFRLRPFTLDAADDERDYQAVLAYQGAMAFVYLADRSTCESPGTVCDWRMAPRFEEDVLAVVQGFDRANRHGEGAPKLQGTIDLIFAREPRNLGEPAAPFQVWDGSALVPIGVYLSMNPRPDLLRLEKRLEQLAVGPYGHRAGDVLLLARSGMNRPIDDRFYFSQRFNSWHGSPEAQDSLVPMIVAHRARAGSDLKRRVGEVVGDLPSQLDFVPLVEALLAGGPNGVG